MYNTEHYLYFILSCLIYFAPIKYRWISLISMNSVIYFFISQLKYMGSFESLFSDNSFQCKNFYSCILPRNIYFTSIFLLYGLYHDFEWGKLNYSTKDLPYFWDSKRGGSFLRIGHIFIGGMLSGRRKECDPKNRSRTRKTLKILHCLSPRYRWYRNR